MNTSGFILFFKNLLSFFVVDVINICLFCAIFLFSLSLFLYCKIKRKLAPKRLYLSLLFVFSILIISVNAICFENISYALFLYALYLLFGAFCYIPILVVCGRIKLKEEEKRLISFIDKEIEKSKAISQSIKGKQVEVISVCKQEQKETEKENKENLENRYSVNFSHIKNVIERLEYFPLSVAEKKQIESLESIIYSAENGAKKEDIKEKLNDGLGYLLKIMAKYGA